MEGMTFAMLLYYMTGFPLQLAVAVIPFFLPLKKKQRWPLRLPLAILLPAVEIGLGLLLYPRLALTEFSSQLFFAAHFLLICALYGVGLCILTEASPLEASYCAVCAYMTQHLFYCIALVRSHLLDMPAWWETEAMVYVRLALVCAAVYLLFVRRICRDGHYPNSVLRALTLYTLVMAVMFFLSIRVSDMDNGWLHGLYTGMLIIILMMEEERSAEQLRLQEEMQTRERMESTQRAQYEMSKENIALLNRKSHDLRRQVAALRTVGTLEEQEEVISEIEQAVAIYDSTFQTGSRALDTVLTQKALQCSQHKIELSVMADGRLLRFMRSVELFTLLSNMLDNAIEANVRIPEEGRRSIHLSVHEKAGLIILQCENPYTGTIEMKDGLPVTAKEDRENHGIGTRSIAATAAKYGGVMRIDTRGGMYVLRLIFQPPDANQDEKSTSQDKAA